MTIEFCIYTTVVYPVSNKQRHRHSSVSSGEWFRRPRPVDPPIILAGSLYLHQTIDLHPMTSKPQNEGAFKVCIHDPYLPDPKKKPLKQNLAKQTTQERNISPSHSSNEGITNLNRKKCEILTHPR